MSVLEHGEGHSLSCVILVSFYSDPFSFTKLVLRSLFLRYFAEGVITSAEFTRNIVRDYGTQTRYNFELV